MQEDTRIERDEGGKNLSIGYYIMKVIWINQIHREGCISVSKGMQCGVLLSITQFNVGKSNIRLLLVKRGVSSLHHF